MTATERSGTNGSLARVMLLSASPADDPSGGHRAPLKALVSCAGRDRFGIHTTTDDPEAADVIIFVEAYGAGWYFEGVRAHPLTNRFREKCFLFSSNPLVIPFLPGIYTGIDRRWASKRAVAGFYVRRLENEFVSYEPPRDNLPYLFSFIGSIQNASIRRDLATISHPRGFFRDTSADFKQVLDGTIEAQKLRDYRRRYAEITKASKFVLCPRGISAASIRLFETMQMGRVPVILSDDWAAPDGPQWNEFALRVCEKEYRRLPKLLEEREADAVALGVQAHAQWCEWFSEEVVFHRAVEACLLIEKERIVPESLARWSPYLHYMRPFHFRRLARSAARAARRFFRS